MNKSGRKSIWDTPEPAAQDTAEQFPGETVTSPPSRPATAVIEQLRVAEAKQRDRSWEKRTANRPTTYRGVPPKLQAAIKEVAADLQVNVDDVGRAFLEFGMQCYQQGEIRITAVLSNQRLTLFPTADAWGSKSRPGWFEQAWDAQTLAPDLGVKQRNRRKVDAGAAKPWQWPRVSYRGLPDGLKAAIQELHQQHHVPAGEVVTLLLGHALDAYQNGRLVLNPQPRSGSSLTFSER